MCCIVAPRTQVHSGTRTLPHFGLGKIKVGRHLRVRYSSGQRGTHRPLARIRDGCAQEQRQPESTSARIWRKAGATVRPNAKLQDMNVTVRADDERCTEVHAAGLPFSTTLKRPSTLICGARSRAGSRPRRRHRLQSSQG